MSIWRHRHFVQVDQEISKRAKHWPPGQKAQGFVCVDGFVGLRWQTIPSQQTKLVFLLF